MTPIIIGAGRGRRLLHLTEEIPKPLVPIVGKPMLEHVLMALEAGGFSREEVVFVRGYLGEVIAERYPELSYVDNADWPNNNILASLLCAREHMSEGFVSSYADIVYEPLAITELMASKRDIALVCDTDWRRRYQGRSQHPESDAEKVRVEGDRIVEISRRIAAGEASGEFIGVMKLSPSGSVRFVRSYDEARHRHGEDAVFREGRPFRKAYLVDLLQHMIEAGHAVHWVPIAGGYMEIDTTEDAARADEWWFGPR
jgi:choline kinase